MAKRAVAKRAAPVGLGPKLTTPSLAGAHTVLGVGVIHLTPFPGSQRPEVSRGGPRDSLGLQCLLWVAGLLLGLPGFLGEEDGPTVGLGQGGRAGDPGAPGSAPALSP